jgi:hypothetical protein
MTQPPDRAPTVTHWITPLLLTLAVQSVSSFLQRMPPAAIEVRSGAMSVSALTTTLPLPRRACGCATLPTFATDQVRGDGRRSEELKAPKPRPAKPPDSKFVGVSKGERLR